jgi:flagellar biosynthesis protein FlhG
MSDFPHPLDDPRDLRDQAAGLRRIFGSRPPLKVASFASGTPGVGKTSVVANVAVALARQGSEVLVIDENAGVPHASPRLGDLFGIEPKGDLLQVLDGRRSLAEVAQSAFPGVALLPAGLAARRFGCLSAAQRQALQDSLTAPGRPVDVILVDTSASHAQGFSPWGLAAGEAVMVVSGSGASIMDAYALIKKVSQVFSRRHFRILVNRVRTPEEGGTIFANLQKVAAERGIARLEYGGAIPAEPRMRHMAQLCQPLVAGLPESEAATALRAFAAHLATSSRADYKEGVEQFVHVLLNCCHKDGGALMYG